MSLYKTLTAVIVSAYMLSACSPALNLTPTPQPQAQEPKVALVTPSPTDMHDYWSTLSLGQCGPALCLPEEITAYFQTHPEEAMQYRIKVTRHVMTPEAEKELGVAEKFLVLTDDFSFRDLGSDPNRLFIGPVSDRIVLYKDNNGDKEFSSADKQILAHENSSKGLQRGYSYDPTKAVNDTTGSSDIFYVLAPEFPLIGGYLLQDQLGFDLSADNASMPVEIATNMTMHRGDLSESVLPAELVLDGDIINVYIGAQVQLQMPPGRKGSYNGAYFVSARTGANDTDWASLVVLPKDSEFYENLRIALGQFHEIPIKEAGLYQKIECCRDIIMREQEWHDFIVRELDGRSGYF